MVVGVRDDAQAFRTHHQQPGAAGAGWVGNAQGVAGEQEGAAGLFDRQEGRFAEEFGDEAIGGMFVDRARGVELAAHGRG